METLIINQALELNSAMAEQVKELYVTSFPESERTSFSIILDGIRNGGICVYIAVDQTDKLIGFATITRLQRIGVWFLDYIAVTEKSRNQGVGSKLIRLITNDLKLIKAPGLIFEVETEDEGLEEEKDIRKRRIEFYKRNGARPVECAPYYRMPNLAGEGSLGMRLMWIPILEESLHGSRLEECIKDMYSQLYGREMGDPLLNQILKDLIC
jgi:GNAT superfamily N-acetyltransferase